MNQGTQRTPCPKCRANNFSGQTNCWQCGSSLPPPEAVGAATPTPYPQPAPQRPAENPASLAPAPFVQPPAYFSPPVRSGVGLGLRIAIWAVLLIPILAAGAYMAFQRRAIGGVDSQAQAAIEANEKLMREFGQQVRQSGSGTSDPDVLDPNSPTAQARREIKRLEEKGVIPTVPPTDAEGRIHLQSGGTISPEEWRRARESLGNPPH